MKENQTVLVVDDEAKILTLIKSYLEINGFNVLCATSGGDGMKFFEQRAVDLILLDLMLPDFSGEEFCRRVRNVSNVPIIMLTAKVEEEDIIRSLNTGADDYVCKPFSPRQLTARVKAVLRRSAAHGDIQAKKKILSCGELIVDTESRLVTINDAPVNLTRDEYLLLTLLMSRRAKIFTRDEILFAIKGDDYDGFDRAVDTHIKNLRAKLGDDPRSPRYIVTAHGMGYRFGADN